MKHYTVYTDKKECCGCYACADACNAGAIHMVSDERGFFYPQVDEKKCTGCGWCRQVCPTRHQKGEKGNPLYFGVQAKCKEDRYSSSSGGMHTVLAQYVFQQQGVVYGAAFDNNMKVVHTEACDMKQLEKLKKTKYVQSDLTGIYQRIKGRLNDGCWVLFCGTPCQVYALQLFLGRPYPRLIVADLVCYGVPSPGIWKSYVKYLEQKHCGKLTEFYFRDKRNRDNGHTCSYVIENIEYVKPLHRDAYCRMYFGRHILRPSCHSCKFSTIDRSSDFTIGDLWGIERIRPDMDDGMGTSLVILQSDKAKAIWDIIKDEIYWFQCEKEEILQPRLKRPVPIPMFSRCFMLLYKILPFPLLVKLAGSRIYSLLK